MTSSRPIAIIWVTIYSRLTKEKTEAKVTIASIRQSHNSNPALEQEAEVVLVEFLTGLKVCVSFRKSPPSLEGWEFYPDLLCPQIPAGPRPGWRVVAPPQPELHMPSGHIPELPGKEQGSFGKDPPRAGLRKFWGQLVCLLLLAATLVRLPAPTPCVSRPLASRTGVLPGPGPGQLYLVAHPTQTPARPRCPESDLFPEERTEKELSLENKGQLGSPG